jgi:hypothetical protein
LAARLLAFLRSAALNSVALGAAELGSDTVAPCVSELTAGAVAGEVSVVGNSLVLVILSGI